jgi:acid phosphatase type 7
MKRMLGVIVAAAIACSCGGGITQPGPPGGGGSATTLTGAGDIADCDVRGSVQTANLLDNISGALFAAGDNAYPSGSEANYRQCYDPTWGRHKARTRPVPGNHEYEMPGAAPYFAYFGPSAGTPGQGYYSYAVGTWRVIALNSEIDVRATSAQVTWLRSELSTSSARCTAVIFHRPRFSSGEHGDNPDMGDVWRVLYDNNADVVISGHDHNYERLSPMDADGRFDALRGIRQFVVGTGGAALRAPTRMRPNSEVTGVSWGVISFNLSDDGYSWNFVSTGLGFTDSGVDRCH